MQIKNEYKIIYNKMVSITRLLQILEKKKMINLKKKNTTIKYLFKF